LLRANWWTLGEPKLHDSMTPVSLNSTEGGRAYLPRLCFSAEFDKSKIRYAFVTENGLTCSEAFAKLYVTKEI
jgi:hypothetical protein